MLHSVKPTNTSITLAPMTTLKISNGPVKEDVLVVGLVSTSTQGGLAIESGDLKLDTKSLVASLIEVGATGKADEITKIPGGPTRMIVFTGLGAKSNSYPHEVLRRAAGSAARALAGSNSALFALPTKDIEAVAALAEGATLGAYVFNEFRGATASEQKSALKSATVHSKFADKPAAKQALKRAMIIAKYTHLVRDLINTPPSHLTPDSFTKKFVTAFKAAGGLKAGLKVTIWNEKELKSEGFGGIIGVGQGSANPPRLLHIAYTPKVKNKKRSGCCNQRALPPARS